MVKYYDQTKNELFELRSFDIKTDSAMKGYLNNRRTHIQERATMSIDCSNFPINYIQEIISESFYSSSGYQTMKKDYARNIYIQCNNDRIIVLLGCVMTNIEAREDGTFFNMDFNIDSHHEYHGEDDVPYEIIQLIRQKKIDNLLD